MGTSWTDRFRFPTEVRDFSLLHCVQTGSGAHPATYPIGTRDLKLTTHLHIVLKSIMVELCLHSPIRFLVVALN
jgi:hypothetical protein